MTIVLHLTESTADAPTHVDHVHLVRHDFAEAIADDGLASLLEAISGLDPTDGLIVVHPDIDRELVDRLTALLRRSQRRRELTMVPHGLGPLAADLLVEGLVPLLSDPSVGLRDAADWCLRSGEMITDVVWTTRPNARWAQLDLRDRLRARLPGRRVRTELGPARHTAVATRNNMLAGLDMSSADVVVSGRDSRVVARAVQQLGTCHARSVRVVESGAGSAVDAELVISSTIKPVSSAPAPGPRATTEPPGSGSTRPGPHRRG